MCITLLKSAMQKVKRQSSKMKCMVLTMVSQRSVARLPAVPEFIHMIGRETPVTRNGSHRDDIATQLLHRARIHNACYLYACYYIACTDTSLAMPMCDRLYFDVK